jgi:nucleotide-binding universal stress UspA family protein
MTRIVVGYDGGEQSHDALALGSVARGVDRRERDPATTFPHMLPRVDEGSTTAFARESDSIAGAFATSRAARARISSSRARPTVAPWAACFRAGGGVGPPDRDPPERGRCTKVLVSGSPAEILVSKGRRAVDLMVTGTRGYGRLLRFLLGSVSSDVVRRAPWPVIVVPPTARIELAQRDGERAHRQQLVSHWSKL